MVRDACCTLAVVVGLTGTVQAGQRPVDTPLPLRSQTVAILPFVNISDAAADQWFGTGIAETLATDLQRAAGITVIHGEALTRAPLTVCSPGTTLINGSPSSTLCGSSSKSTASFC